MISSAINSLIAQDEHCLRQLHAVQGKTLKIEVTDFSQSFTIRMVTDGIQFESALEDIDVCIQGKAMSLLGMVTAEKTGGSFPKDITLIGDIHLAQQIQTIAKDIEIDWEELLSHYVGDIAAHQMGRVINTGLSNIRDIMTSLKNSSSEYLRFEAEILPDQGLIDEFSRDVESLRDDTERLKSRVQRLERKLTQKRQGQDV